MIIAASRSVSRCTQLTIRTCAIFGRRGADYADTSFIESSFEGHGVSSATAMWRAIPSAISSNYVGATLAVVHRRQ